MTGPEGELTDDQVRLVFLWMSPAGLALLGGLVFGAWAAIVEKLLAYQLIVPAAADPLLVLPRSGGAGLDGARCWAAAAVLGLVLLVVAAITRAAHTRDDR